MGVDRNKIKQLRDEKGMTLEEAAKRAGFKDRQRWYAIESGQRSNLQATTLAAVAKALGCKMGDLLEPER